jgi:pimeloyl-ACP methyl ester carboxylesterase
MESPVATPWSVLREGLGLLELPRLALRFPELLRVPRGDGQPVMVLPGFGTGDVSTHVLRQYLRLLGYSVRGWSLGVNRGNVRALLPRVLGRVARFADRTGEPVRLIGWSLGGVLAREAAREEPSLVRQVITLGSPIVGGPKYTTAARFYRMQGVDLEAIEREIEARNATLIRVPITSIYSRADGVVAWQACIDRRNPDVENIEVNATHLGLGFSADVYRLLAERLAR